MKFNFSILISLSLFICTLCLKGGSKYSKVKLKNKLKSKECGSPVIGIIMKPELKLEQGKNKDQRADKTLNKNKTSSEKNKTRNKIIELNYVNWLQKGGARVIPIDYSYFSKNETNLIKFLNKLNGVLIQGNTNFKKNSHYTKIVYKILDYAIENFKKNKTFSVLGIDTGMHLIARHSVLDFEKYLYKNPNKLNSALKGIITRNNTRLFKTMTITTKNIFSKVNSLFHRHLYSIKPDIEENKNFSKLYRVSSTSDNPENQTDYFTNIIEGKNGLPILGFQFFPEKYLNDYYSTDKNIRITRDRTKFNDGATVSSFFSNYFIGISSRSKRCMIDSEFTRKGGITQNVKNIIDKLKSKGVEEWHHRCRDFIYTSHKQNSYNCPYLK